MKVKIAPFILLFLCLTLSFKYPNADCDKIIGVYWSPKKDGKISIYKKNGKYYGNSVESKTPDLKDKYNPKPELRNRIVLGQDVFFDFIFEDDEYIDGTIYNPLDGKTYSAKMWLEGNSLRLRGFIGFSMFGKTETLERVL